MAKAELKRYQKTYQYDNKYARKVNDTSVRIDLDVLDHHLDQLVTHWNRNQQHQPIRTHFVSIGDTIKILNNEPDFENELNELVDIELYAYGLSKAELAKLDEIMDDFVFTQTNYKGQRALKAKTNFEQMDEPELTPNDYFNF